MRQTHTAHKYRVVMCMDIVSVHRCVGIAAVVVNINSIIIIPIITTKIIIMISIISSSIICMVL